jgi:hypothetical protein
MILGIALDWYFTTDRCVAAFRPMSKVPRK